MSFKVSSALLSATLLFASAACTPKKDAAEPVTAQSTPAPRIPINTDKAAGLEKKQPEKEKQNTNSNFDATSSGATPAPPKLQSPSEPTAPASSATEVKKKESFNWQIPFVPAKSALEKNLAGKNQGPEVPQNDPATKESKPGVDYSSQAIKKEAFAKISFENLDEIAELMKNPDSVIYKGQISSEKNLAERIKSLNEENYCKVTFTGDVHKEDFFRLDAEKISSTPLDTENVVNVFKATYKNSTGEVLLTCTHTTSNFFMQTAQMDLAKWITFYDFTGNKIDTTGYKNPLTEERKINAVKIKDLEKFKKIIMEENSQDSFAVLKGEVLDATSAFRAVAKQKETQACVVIDLGGTPTHELTYVRVAKGILEQTPPENPNASMYMIYRADAENFFILNCFMAKSEQWTKLMDTAQGVLEFGALDRVPLLKKGPELQKIQDDYEASLRN